MNHCNFKLSGYGSISSWICSLYYRCCWFTATWLLPPGMFFSYTYLNRAPHFDTGKGTNLQPSLLWCYLSYLYTKHGQWPTAFTKFRCSNIGRFCTQVRNCNQETPISGMYQEKKSSRHQGLGIFFYYRRNKKVEGNEEDERDRKEKEEEGKEKKLSSQISY